MASNGAIGGSGKSSVFGTILLISGTLGNTSISPVQVQGAIGSFPFTATIDAATGKVVGQYGGAGASGKITAQRSTP